jgi:fumarylpyruvate hydrolase
MDTRYTHPPVAWPVAEVDGETRVYPVRRIFCVGRNYADHAREMGRDPDREPPFFFMKSPDAFIPSGRPVRYPPETADFHYEMELVVALGGACHRATPGDAERAIFGFAAGLDMTRRDLQLEARAQGRPWDVGKSFEDSAVLAPIRPLTTTGLMRRGAITLQVNGDLRQSADLADLIWPVVDIVAILSRFYRLAAGDLIYTGTPAGVGPVFPGDELRGEIEGLPPVVTRIASAPA